MVKFEPDTTIRVHERGVIAQLCSLFRSHEQGLPEWFKNASTAYARDNAPTEYRLLTLLTGHLPEGGTYIALLDHVGMSVEDLENRFANWGDPKAHLAAAETTEILEGGHGNGGKCYMTQMFEDCSYLHTLHNGRASRYGFVGDEPRPGYFPDRREGRGYPVSKPIDELKRALAELGIDIARLPEEVRTASAVRTGFTLVVGRKAKHLEGREDARRLAESVLHHAQMALTVETNRIFWMHDGKVVPTFSPVTLPEIQPHEYAPDPRTIPVPAQLPDPQTGRLQDTRPDGSPAGKLILRTAKTSMRRTLRSRHHIRFVSRGRPVAFMRMESISRSTWVDRMYGECQLDVLSQYETPDRTDLAEAPLTRALEEWIRTQVLDYEAEFKRLDRLSASQEYKNRAQELNRVLDRWKNRFLDEFSYGSGGPGAGRGRHKPRPRPLPERPAVGARIDSPFHKAGVGVWLRINVTFTDSDGSRVAAPAHMWHSSDWAVATVDDNRLVTHSPGQVQVWIEALDGSIRSNPVEITVLDTVRSRVEPSTIELPAGSVRELTAVVTDRDGVEHRAVYMTWVQDDSSVVAVTATGKLVAHKQGSTRVYAVDERTMAEPGACVVAVTAANTLPGDRSGKAYPMILLSEIDPDPLNPDQEPVHLSPEDGPVHQPTPQHVEHNIWWINLQCPLAKLYFSLGPDSREWRSYHIERYIEALAKIHLSHDFQVADEEITFDAIERRWREVASEVQRRALDELRPLLEGEDFGD